MAHITRPTEFRRAFAGATVHDFFNLLSVIVLLPLEIATHYLEHYAIFLQDIFRGMGGATLVSPLKVAVKPVAHALTDLICSLVPHGTFAAIITLVLAIAILFFSLSRLVTYMKALIIGKIERLLHNYIFCNAIRAFLLGTAFTAIVQSSSVTTSLIVPLVGAGILSLEQIFPYTLGANIGTTVTALLASFVTQNPTAIATAFVHLLFNISGTIIWFPLKKVPISIARFFGDIAFKRRWLAISYMVMTFYIIPLIIAGILERS